MYDALRSNSNIWEHTLFVITYDEHGGLFDHVVPKIAERYKAPLVNSSETISSSPTRERDSNTSRYEDVFLGLRVPTFLISPYVKRGSVVKTKLDHTSILKSIIVRFCNEKKPFISDRVRYANSFGEAITSELRNIENRSPILPELPNMRRLRSSVLADNFKPMTKESLSDKKADFHEFMSFLRRVVKK